MADTLKYDPKHFYDEDAIEIFDPIIDEVNDILEGKEVPPSCTITNNYLYYLATEYDRLDPSDFMHLPEVEEARELLKERFDKLSEKENQIVIWYTKQFQKGHSTYAAQFYGLYDRWLTSLIQFKADFEQEGLMLSAMAQQNTKKNKKLMS